MKVPLSWLKEFVEIDCSAEELAGRLTFSGLEVEDIALDRNTGGEPEAVLSIEVTPNRADCLSVLGIARETAALLGKPVTLPDIKLGEAGPAVDTCAKVIVDDAIACPRYTARAVCGVKVAPSPLWMSRRLEQCGVRPINNVVDITNYVMLECGQPMHAFDLALLDEATVIVRRAGTGERITTLEDVECELTPDFLVIADARKPVALAGVMGGAGSGISGMTSSVLLESACFDPSIIRKSSRALAITSESSRRFGHGVDIEAVEWASRRGAALMLEFAGGTLAKGVIDKFAGMPERRKITCRFASVRQLLGIRISAGRVLDIFKSLGLKVVESNRKECIIQAPAFRNDLENEADLIEEVARIHGLDRIPFATPVSSVVQRADDSPVRAAMLCRARLAGLGLTEIANYSFVSEHLLNLFDPNHAERRVVLPHPVSSEQSVMRNSLLPQMAETLGRNLSRGLEEAAFFETGRIFYRDGNDELREEERLAIGLMGQVGRLGPGRKDAPGDQELFLWLKGVFERLCAAMRVFQGGPDVSALKFVRLDPDDLPDIRFPLACFERNRSVYVLHEGLPFAVLGLLKESIRREWRMRTPIAVLEAGMQPLLKQVFATRSVKPISAFPSVERDIALVVDDKVSHEDIVEVIRKVASNELTDIRLFDIYYSKELGVGRKGMAYSLKYCSFDRTLTDDEVNEFHTAIKAGIRNVLNVEIREG